MVYNTIIFLHRPLQNIFYLPKQCKQKKKKKEGEKGRRRELEKGRRGKGEKKIKSITDFKRLLMKFSITLTYVRNVRSSRTHFLKIHLLAQAISPMHRTYFCKSARPSSRAGLRKKLGKERMF